MATDALNEATYYGTWRIVECVSLSGNVETTGIEGTEFHLDENGDVSWKVSEDGENMPFFSCESYELNFADTEFILLKFRGTYAGHVIEFRVDIADDLMLLTYERCCMLQCQKVSSFDPKHDTPFSLLNALEEGYFSDISIYADTGKEFKVHSIILGLNAPEIEWAKEPPPLSGCQEDVLKTILHYLYTECLPQGLSEETARRCIQEVVKISGFSKFSGLCDTFLKNTALKEQITNLITDMHGCADRIIELFAGNCSVGSDGHVTIDESLMSTPAKLSYLLKQAMREAAVAGIKLVILCDLFSRRKGELSREERHDIIKYTRSRLPVFMQQVKKFLDIVTQHCSSLTTAQRDELATFFVPELETVIETISHFGIEARAALDRVIKSSAATSEKDKPEKSKKGNVGDVLGRKLRNALHVRELKKLKKLSEKASQSYGHLTIQKDRFLSMSQQQRVRLVSKNMKQVVEEVPVIMRKLEEFMSEIDEKLTWRDWKYLFKLGTSKVSWVLNKSQTNKQTLQSLINWTSDMVHREQFAAAVSTLGLSENVKEDGSPSQNTTTTKYAQLSSVESLCVPPCARDSNLARKSVELLKNGTKTDMIFEVIQVSENTGDEVIDHTSGETDSQLNPERDVDVSDIPAHCVIIAARCDWYRRALLSGMRESIDKKITVHDTNPRLFRLLLDYLYSGQVETNELSTEQLVELLTLSDRYEVDSLKCVCEQALKHHLDDDTSLYMLSLADQLNAKSLKDYTVAYLVEHPHIAADDVFIELPEHLQTEVEGAISWHGLNSRTRHLRKPNRNSSSSDSTISEVDELGNLDIPHRPLAGSTSSSSDDLQFFEDNSRLETCLLSLRDIVGDSVPQDELVRVAIAADYDTNRALNFLFS